MLDKTDIMAVRRRQFIVIYRLIQMNDRKRKVSLFGRKTDVEKTVTGITSMVAYKSILESDGEEYAKYIGWFAASVVMLYELYGPGNAGQAYEAFLDGLLLIEEEGESQHGTQEETGSGFKPKI